MAVFSKLYKCFTCDHTMIDHGQAARHNRRCKEFGGPVDRRNNLFKVAKDMSLKIDGTHKHTYNEMKKLMEKKEEPIFHEAIDNDNDVLTEDETDAEVEEAETDDATNDFEKLSIKDEDNTKESYYQEKMMAKYKGYRTANSAGITDVTTDAFHMEIKRGEHWRAGIRQLLAYKSAEHRDELRLCLFAFNKLVTKKIKNALLQSCLNGNIDLYLLDEKGNDSLVLNTKILF